MVYCNKHFSNRKERKFLHTENSIPVNLHSWNTTSVKQQPTGRHTEKLQASNTQFSKSISIRVQSEKSQWKKWYSVNCFCPLSRLLLRSRRKFRLPEVVCMVLFVFIFCQLQGIYGCKYTN